jgi:hypothetical protein
MKGKKCQCDKRTEKLKKLSKTKTVKPAPKTKEPKAAAKTEQVKKCSTQAPAKTVVKCKHGKKHQPKEVEATLTSDLLVNNTVFVDTQFGSNVTGIREDESRPVQTIAQAVSIAIAGDTIYVQPGDYNESGFVLKDGVNYYFTEGASVIGASGSVFTDTGAAAPVTVTITGYGRFSSSDGPILSLSQASTVTLQGDSFSATGSPALIEITSASTATLNVKSTSLTATGTTQLLRITGAANITAQLGKLSAESQHIFISDTASGRANVQANSISGGQDDVAGAGAIFVASNDFVLSVSAQTFEPVTTTHAIQVLVAATAPNNTRCQFNFQYVKVAGGVLRVAGSSSAARSQSATQPAAQSLMPVTQCRNRSLTQFPAPTSQLLNQLSSQFKTQGVPHTAEVGVSSLLDQPRVNLNVHRLLSSSPDVSAFDLASSIVNLNLDFFFYELGDDTYAFVFAEGVLVALNCQQLGASAGGASPGMFRVIGSTDPSAPTMARLQSNLIFSPGTMLHETDDNLNVTLRTEQMVIVVPPGVSAAIINGQNLLTIDMLVIYPNGDPFVGSPVPVFDISNTYAILQIGVMLYNISNSIGIRSRNSSVTYAGSRIEAGATDTLIFDVGGELNLRLDSIGAYAGGNVISVSEVGSANVNINNIYVGGSGYGILLNGGESSGGHLNGFISILGTTLGPAIRSTSQGIIHLLFNTIETQGGDGMGGFGGICIDLPGKGDTYLIGSRINLNYCQTGITVGDPLAEGDGALLTLRVGDIYSNLAEDIIRINAPGGGAVLDFQTVRSNTVTHAGIWASAGSVEITGGTLQVKSFVTDIYPTGILVDGVTHFNANIGSVLVTGPAIYVSTDNQFWYKAVRTEVEGPANHNVITVEAQNEYAQYTFGGYMRTNGPNTVEIVGAFTANLRFSGSTFVSDSSGGYSILNSTANSARATIQQSIATNDVSSNVNIVPNTSIVLVVDSQVS